MRFRRSFPFNVECVCCAEQVRSLRLHPRGIIYCGAVINEREECKNEKKEGTGPLPSVSVRPSESTARRPHFSVIHHAAAPPGARGETSKVGGLCRRLRDGNTENERPSLESEERR